MNKRGNVAFLFVSAAVLIARPAWAEVRTWTDSSGSYKVTAEFVDENSGSVRLSKSDGRIISLPWERLSAADQAYIRNQRGGTDATAEPADPLVPSPTPVTIELLSGAKISGRISAKDGQSVMVEADVGGRTYTRKYPLDRIRAVVVGGQRTVLNESSGGASPLASASSGKPAVAPTPSTKRVPGPGSSAKSGAAIGAARSRAEIENLIEEMGRTPPDWWDATPLDYPQTLDLTWPEKAEGDWNAQKNVSQYLWDVIQLPPKPSSTRPPRRWAPV